VSEVIKNYWYLICPSSEVKDQIITKTVLGEKIIIYRDQNGHLAALEDRCCHRNVQLSLGYLREGRVVCGYHGWEYDKSGNCILIPSQLPENKIPPTAKIKSYPVQEFNRWVWIFIGDPEKSNTIKPLDIPEMNQWDFTYKAYVFKADLESTAESLVDPYHIAFAHRNSIRSFMGQIEEFPADFDIKFHDDGIEGHYNRANRGTFFEKMYFGHDDNLDTYYRFYFPNMSRLQINFKNRTLLILEHVMQVDENHVEMMQITLWKNIFSKFPAFGKYFMARKSAKIVGEDIELLESQKKLIKDHGESLREISVKGDEVSLAFRKYWRRMVKENGIEPDAE
jgi:phenylpropionate dioxygenase-like ring-hydroxylating dioxygenase large terminal subunit